MKQSDTYTFSAFEEACRKYPERSALIYLRRIIITNLTDMLYTWQKIFGTLVDKIPR